MLPELARVRVADIEELLARPEEAEKPLSSRERNNLLRVIRALCQQADIDLVNGKGTAQVAKALELAGFDGPKDKTLRALLSEVRKIRSEEHTSELQSLMRISYAVFCLKKKKTH